MTQFISSIRIKNFRSIVDQRFDLSDESLSIFVGRNDAGKSNVLRALNLFFNDETDFGTAFRFSDDYSYMAETGTGKAKEILVELTIEPPKRLKGAKTVKWSKRWRLDNTKLEDKIKFVKGPLVKQTSGTNKWLQKLKFRYVPAQKGISYFSRLMSELHDVLNEVHSDEFSQSATGFIENIQEISEDISTEIEQLIGLPSRIQAPSDFRVLFSNLDFGETHDGNTYLLKRRGDGIRAWHIPVILKVMAKKEQEVTRSGYVKPDTIWGFEEPENNLELSNAFQLAEQIYGFASEIQIFMTTHSPAFYALSQKTNDRSATYYLTKGADRITRLIDFSAAEIDEEMGILHLITPHVKEANDQLQGLKEEIEGLRTRAITSPVFVLCEDEDNELLQVLFRSSGVTDFDIQPYGGCGNVKGAFQMARLIQDRAAGISVIVHRDRDYINEEEVADLHKRAQKAGCSLFITSGTDVETHFLNADYVASFGDISTDDAERYISDATQNTRAKSLDKFSASIRNQDGSWYISKIEDEYNQNQLRYRHGKTVLGELKRIYQEQTGNNLPVGEEHESLAVEVISRLHE